MTARPTPYRSTAMALCLAAVAIHVSAQEPVMFRGDPARTGVYGDPGPATGAVIQWRYQATGPVRSSPAVTPTTVLVGTSAGTLLALDRATGALRWRYDAGSPLPSSPAVARGIVVIGARDGSVHAVDTATGARRWATGPVEALPLPWGREGWDYWVSSPAVVGDRVLMATPDGRLAALDLGSGAERWSYDLGARTRSSPAVADGRVFLGDDAGIVHAVSLADGRPLWRHETEGAGMESAEYGWDRVSLQASPAVADGVVYIGSRDGGVYALDAATGDRLWYVDHGAPWVVASAAVDGRRLWVGSSDGLFVAGMMAGPGEEQWRTRVGARVFASPALADGTLYVADHRGRVHALDPADGSVRWRVATSPGVMIQSSPVPSGRSLYFGTDDGSVYALGPAPAPPRMAVVWDTTLAEQAFRARNGRMLSDYLADFGYEVLDGDAVGRWLDERIADDAPSAIVFSVDVLPSGALERDRLRRYLETGGKVVWTGFPPGALVRDSTGQVAGIDYAGTESLLGIDASATAQGQYGAAPTALGRAWGLDGVRLSEVAVAGSPDVRVLAVDELGRAAAVVREFGGPGGSGFVLLWGTGADWDRLAVIRAVTEYGVLRVP